MLGILQYRTVSKIVNGRLLANLSVISEAEIPFPSTAVGPLILQGSSLYFALRFDQPVTTAQIGTPMARLTIDGRLNKKAATLTVDGHLSVCTDDHIRAKFAANLHHIEQFQVMVLKCQSAHWKSFSSEGVYHFR